MPAASGFVKPRLSSDPVPLPAEYQRDGYADGHALFDLDRVLEIPWVRQWFTLPPDTAPATLDEKQRQLVAQHHYFSEIVAYCCAGLVNSDGTPLPASPTLDDVAGWEAESRAVVLWLATVGLTQADGVADAPFRAAATEPE